MGVIKVVPNKDFTVRVHFSDGNIFLYNAFNIISRFPVLQDVDYFIKRCTIINNTLAWDISGDLNDAKCLDIAPENIIKNGQILNYR